MAHIPALHLAFALFDVGGEPQSPSDVSGATAKRAARQDRRQARKRHRSSSRCRVFAQLPSRCRDPHPESSSRSRRVTTAPRVTPAHVGPPVAGYLPIGEGPSPRPSRLWAPHVPLTSLPLRLDPDHRVRRLQRRRRIGFVRERRKLRNDDGFGRARRRRAGRPTSELSR